MNTFLWYIPNTVEPGHRGDDVPTGWADLELSAELAAMTEQHGWAGALLGTGWGRPDTLTLATALAARTTTFRPLAAIRPGYWAPAQFASAAATLDRLSGGRLLVNVVSGHDDIAAYGDDVADSAARYARTAEFMQLTRRLWQEEQVTFGGQYFWVKDSSLPLRPAAPPPLYFGGASPAAERVAAEHADVQLLWGEPLDGVAQRIARLRSLAAAAGRELAPLQFGLRVTTVVREDSARAWAAAERKVAAMAAAAGRGDGTPASLGWARATGQQRLVALAQRGQVLDSCLYTEPARHGGQGAGTTWLVGSYDEVAAALARYAALGVSHFIVSDTPYKSEAARCGDELLPRLRALLAAPGQPAEMRP